MQNYLKNSINVVQSYIDHLTISEEMTKTDIAAELAVDFDRPKSYHIQKLNQWLNGTQPLPRPVYEHMMQAVTACDQFPGLTAAEKAKCLGFPERK